MNLARGEAIIAGLPEDSLDGLFDAASLGALSRCAGGGALSDTNPLVGRLPGAHISCRCEDSIGRIIPALFLRLTLDVLDKRLKPLIQSRGCRHDESPITGPL